MFRSVGPSKNEHQFTVWSLI